jgi:dolichyl-diphosphooligosaccharide--protein glycosyltransferase
MSPSKHGLELLLVLVFVAVVAFFVRDVPGLAHPYAPPGASDGRWFSRDADGLYHTRRVARAIEEGSVAERDPYLAYPDGATIPWPPYYDAALACLLAPFTPAVDAASGDARERREFLERAVATAPLVCAVATTLLVAWLAWRLAGSGAALVAGGVYALSRGAINYQTIGNGDHHAAVTLCFTVMLALFTLAARDGGLARPRRAALFGALAGACAGFGVGMWVASFVFVLYAQGVIAWWMLVRAKQGATGVGPFALAFHLVALAVLWPAVSSSPWRAEFPWMVVNLSNFHAAELAVGALISAPLVLAARGPLAPDQPLARAYPWLVGAALVIAGGVIAILDLAPAAGIREGFDWVSRTNQFMDVVMESAPLYGARAESGAFVTTLGYAAPLALIAWAVAARRAFFARANELVPWAIVVPPMALQALQQRRFAEAYSVPQALLLGLGAAWLAAELVRQSRVCARTPRAGWAALAVAAVAAAQSPSLGLYAAHFVSARNWAVGTANDYYLGERELCEWLYAHTERGAWSVLAHWDKGHAIEWVADRPSVATNFGSYVGEDSYRDPPRFFLAEDPDAAEAILVRRRAKYVLVTAALGLNVATLVRATDPSARDRKSVV